jgi:hypothetical protein
MIPTVARVSASRAKTGSINMGNAGTRGRWLVAQPFASMSIPRLRAIATVMSIRAEGEGAFEVHAERESRFGDTYIGTVCSASATVEYRVKTSSILHV